MTKKVIKKAETIVDIHDNPSGITVEALVRKLAEVANRRGMDAIIRADDVYLEYEEEETDEEYATRLSWEERIRESMEQHERNEYERLKAKFGEASDEARG